MNQLPTWTELSLDAGTSAPDAEGPKTAHRKRLAPHIGFVRGLTPLPKVGDGSSTTVNDAGSPSGSPVIASALLASPVVSLPYVQPDARSFKALSKREGVVLALESDEFTARLTNLLGNDGDGLGDLEATFALDEVSPADLALVHTGAIFYWNIGYYDDPSGQRHRVSELRFRRIPVWQPREIANAREEARRLRAELGLDQ